MARVVTLIDGQQLNYMQDDHLQPKGFQIDFVKFKDFLERTHGEIAMIGYYTSSAFPGSAKANFLEFLTNHEYTVETGSDVDALINEQLAKINSENCDVLVLVSGDSDHLEAMQNVRESGVKTVVCCVDGMISRELKETVDQYIDLSEHTNEIIDPERTDKRATKMNGHTSQTESGTNTSDLLDEMIRIVSTLMLQGNQAIMSSDEKEIVIKIKR